MATVEQPDVYDELVDLLVQCAPPDDVLRFQLSTAKQARLDDLLERNRQGELTSRESAELDSYEQFEHVVRLLKARVRQRPAM